MPSAACAGQTPGRAGSAARPGCCPAAAVREGKVRQKRFRPTRACLLDFSGASLLSLAGVLSANIKRREKRAEGARGALGENKPESLVGAVWNEHVAYTPDSLDVAWSGSVFLDQLAQARNLYVQAAVEGLKLTATGKHSQFFARQWLAGVAHQCLEHGEFACRQWQLFAVLLQHAGAQVESEGAKADHFVVARGCAWRFHRGRRRSTA